MRVDFGGDADGKRDGGLFRRQQRQRGGIIRARQRCRYRAADSEGKHKPVIPGVLAPMQAKKIGKVSIDADSIDVYRAGIVYTDSEGKCGVLSLDGKKDTGAKYAKLSSSTLYNDVYMTTVKALTADEQNVNVYGAVAKNGEEAVPCQYAKVEALSERYVKVYTAEEKTDNKDEAVVYFSKNEFSFEPKDGDEMYSGKWEVYDVDKKAFVKGASGTNREDYAIAYGQFLEVRYKASGEKKTFDGNGDSVTDGRKIFSNGSYVLEINGKCAVYDTNDTRLFNFDEKTYRIYDYKEPYFIGKVGSGGYVLINDKGEKVSSEFKGLFSQVFPDFVRSEDTVYRLDGTKLFEEKYDMLNFDSVNRDAYNAYNVTEKTEVVFDKTGEVLFSGNKDTDDFGGMDYLQARGIVGLVFQVVMKDGLITSENQMQCWHLCQSRQRAVHIGLGAMVASKAVD